MILQGIASEIIDRRPGQRLSFILAFLSITFYVQISYFTDRAETPLLIGSYAILFLMYLLLSKSVLSFNFLIGFGILFRLIVLFSLPKLSDDFYRFFWDGILVNNQINPFLYLPREIVENPLINIPNLTSELFASLNSPDYHSVYPPVGQFVFWIAAKFAEGNIYIAVLIMKSFIFFAEMGTIFIMLKLLKIHNLKREYIYFYVLNPLIIIELTGNIHFDGFLIFFVLLSIYLLQKNNLALSSAAFAFAIASKLTPLLLLPLFLKQIKLSRIWIFYGLAIAISAFLFWPFMGSALINGLSSSIGLYFQKFEFNASIFYIIREIGFWVKGWDIIQTAGIWLAGITFTVILFVSFFGNSKKQNLLGIFIWPLFIYFAFASIVHPWYATPLIAFCLFSRYRFPLVWSFTIFLSYVGYSNEGFQEQYWLLFLEYIPVYAVMIYELWKYRDVLVFKNPMPGIIHALKESA